MNDGSTRRLARPQLAVIAAALLVFGGFVLTRSRTAQAHEVTTAYPLTCSMVGLDWNITTTHEPMEGTTPGGTVVLHVHVASSQAPGGMTMGVREIDFSLPKPALIERVERVTFLPGGNLTGTAEVDETGTASLRFTGETSTDAIELPDFEITAVTSTAAQPGERVSWIGPEQVLLDGGSTDACAPAGGVAIQYAPTVVLAGPGCGPAPSTTVAEHGDHGDHDHGVETTTTTMPEMPGMDHGDHGDHDHGAETTTTTTCEPPTTVEAPTTTVEEPTTTVEEPTTTVEEPPTTVEEPTTTVV